MGSQDPGTCKVDPPLDGSEVGLFVHEVGNTPTPVLEEEINSNAKEQQEKNAQETKSKGGAKIHRVAVGRWFRRRLCVTLPDLAPSLVDKPFAWTVNGSQIWVWTLDQVVPLTFFYKVWILVRSTLHVDVNSEFKNQTEKKKEKKDKCNENFLKKRK